MSNQDPANLYARIRDARGIHAQLRAARPTPQTLDEKRPLYETLRSLLAELWSRTERIADRRLRNSLRSAIRGLTVDAEYHAGVQREAEGFREAADVAEQYDLLQAHFNSPPDDPP